MDSGSEETDECLEIKRGVMRITDNCNNTVKILIRKNCRGRGEMKENDRIKMFFVHWEFFYSLGIPMQFSAYCTHSFSFKQIRVHMGYSFRVDNCFTFCLLISFNYILTFSFIKSMSYFTFAVSLSMIILGFVNSLFITVKLDLFI